MIITRNLGLITVPLSLTHINISIHVQEGYEVIVSEDRERKKISVEFYLHL